MAEIRPFRGIFYNQKKVVLTDVVTPPYDKIAFQDRERFYAASPYNIVRIVLGKETEKDTEKNNKYTRAADFFRNWLKKKILIQDEQETIYLYTQEYEINDDKKIRIGFVALAKVEDLDSGVILPHERTFYQYKIDRLNLLRETKTDFDHIFMLYSDPQKRITRFLKEIEKNSRFFEEVTLNGVHHRISRVIDEQSINFIINEMRDKQLLIADGHHRYETSLSYRKEMRDKIKTDKPMDFDYRSMTFFNMDDENLTILPTHRLVRNIDNFNEAELLEKLSEFFKVEEVQIENYTFEELTERIKPIQPNTFSFGLYLGRSKFYVIRMQDRTIIPESVRNSVSPSVLNLDVSILHNFILEKLLNISKIIQNRGRNIKYYGTIEEGIKLVDNGDFQFAFFLNPAKIEQVREVARNCEVMPQKSTDFYPKLLTGLIIRKLES